MPLLHQNILQFFLKISNLASSSIYLLVYMGRFVEYDTVKLHSFSVQFWGVIFYLSVCNCYVFTNLYNVNSTDKRTW